MVRHKDPHWYPKVKSRLGVSECFVQTGKLSMCSIVNHFILRSNKNSVTQVGHTLVPCWNLIE